MVLGSASGYEPYKSCGLMSILSSCRYLEPLAIALDRENWSLVQFLMSSSYSGYGTSSLQQVIN